MDNHTPKVPSAEELQVIDRMTYNPLTGEVIGVHGQFIGSIEQGRVVITLGVGMRRVKRAHIAWYKCRGEWPRKLLDHKNRNSLDDRYENLEESDIVYNNLNTPQTNRRKLPPNVYETPEGNYLARLVRRGVRANLGRFDSPEQATKVLEKARLFWEMQPCLSAEELRVRL